MNAIVADLVIMMVCLCRFAKEDEEVLKYISNIVEKEWIVLLKQKRLSRKGKFAA